MCVCVCVCVCVCSPLVFILMYIQKQEESGHIVLLGVFDSVDDTVLVKKAMINQ